MYRVLAPLILLFTMVLSLHAQGTYTQIDYPDSITTYCYGLNNSGEVVGGYEDSAGGYHGFILSQGTYMTIDYPNAQGSSLSGINNRGKIVGTAENFGFLYDIETQSFTPINYPNATGTYASAINDAGSIVGWDGQSGYTQAFELIGSTYYPAKSYRGDEYAYGIDNAGEIVGYEQYGTVNAYSFYHGAYSPIVILGSPASQVVGISPSGSALIEKYE